MRGKRDGMTTAVAVAALLAIGGCGSARDTYRTGGTWQRDACARLPGATERERCLESAATSHEDYRAAREKALEGADGTDGVR